MKNKGDRTVVSIRNSVSICDMKIDQEGNNDRGSRLELTEFVRFADVLYNDEQSRISGRS